MDHMLRHRITLYLAVFALIATSVVLIYLQRTGKLTLFADVLNTPGTIVVQNEADLQKGITAGDGKTELKDGIVQLKENTEFTSWIAKNPANPPSNETINPGSGDFRDHPIYVSFNTETKKYYVHTERMSFWYDSESNTWEAIRGFNTAWSAWSNKKHKIITYNLTECGGGGGADATIIYGIDPAGGGCETIGNGSILAPYDTLYFDQVNELLVAYRQVSSTYPLPGTPSPDKQVSVFDISSGQLTHSTNPGPSTAWPPVRAGGNVSYDAERKEVLLFGGATVSGGALSNLGSNLPTYTPTTTIWAYNLEARTWVERDAQNAPQGRMYSSIVFDQKNKRFVLFGGLTSLTYSRQGTQTQGTFGASNQTWAYDPAKNSWSQITTPMKPDARFAHGLGYDSVRHEILAFDGMNSGQAATGIPTARNDSWILQGGGYANNGVAQYDIGSPQVTQFLRFQPTKTKDLPEGTKISVEFASSIDGVTYGAFSSPYELKAKASDTDSILLSELNLPQNTHYLRIRCTLSKTDTAKTPTFEGFQVNYQTVDTTTTTDALLTTDKSAYTPGEIVKITLTNTGNTPLNCGGSTFYTILKGTTVIYPTTRDQLAVSVLPGSPLTAQWNQQDNSKTQVPNGTYVVSVDCGGTIKTVSFSIATNAPKTVTFTVNPDKGVAPLNVTATYTGTESNIVWNFGDGTTMNAAKGPSTVTHKYERPGVYTITLLGDGIRGTAQVTITAPEGTSVTPILINGTTPGSDATLANNSGSGSGSTTLTNKPATLVSTGMQPWTIALLLVLAGGAFAAFIAWKQLAKK